MQLRYLVQAWRQIKSQPTLSILKIVGLSLAFAASMLLMKYINWQWNFDRFHEDLDQIFRVATHHQDPESATMTHHAITYSGLGVLAKEKFAAVEDHVRMGRWIANDAVIRHEGSLYRGDGLFFADASFFEVFSFPLISGDPAEVLKHPNTVVLTQSSAQQLFGSENPLGKEVLFENKNPLVVTGIAANPPSQSHIQFDMISPLSTMTNWNLDVYGDQELEAAYVYTYLLIKENSDIDQLASQITKEYNKRKKQDLGKTSFTLTPLDKIHLYAQLEGDLKGNGGGNSIWILGGIAAFILLLGWINYFNIFYATSLDHQTSMSIRRIVGAGRRHVLLQIAVQAGLSILISLILGVFIARFCEAWISSRFGVPLHEVGLFDFGLEDPSTYLFAFLLLGAVVTTFVPALVLSRVGPTRVLRPWQPSRILTSTQQPLLIILQFSILIILLSGTMIIRNQTLYMQSQDLGLKLEQVVAIRGPLGVNYEVLKTALPAFFNELTSLPGVVDVAVSHHIPGDEMALIVSNPQDPESIPFTYYRNYGDASFFDVFEIGFSALDSAALQGTSTADRRFCILNKMAADLLGFYTPENALGQFYRRWNQPMQVIGVVNDFHQRSLHHSLTPIIYDLSTDNIMSDGFFSIKHVRNDPSLLIEDIKVIFKKHFPYTVFEPMVVDQYFASQYRAEVQFFVLNLAFSLLGLIIGGLGLLALIILTIRRRLKEISIRRILGANLSNILWLLSQDYFKILLIALLIAIPLTTYLMNRWLANFAYRIQIEIFTVLGAAFLTFIMGCFIILIQGWRVTTTPPMEVLHDE